MQKPLVMLCVFFCLGILFAIRAEFSLPAVYLFSCGCLVFSLVFVKQKFRFAIFISLAYFMLGAACLRNSQILPGYHISKIMSAAPGIVSLKGMVADDPLITKNKTSFVFIVEELIQGEKRQRVCGKVLVGASENWNFNYGQNLVLTGTLYRPFNFALSSRLKYRDYLQRRNILALLRIKQNSTVKNLGLNTGNPVKRFSFWLKHKMEEVIEQNLDPLPASILNAMVLGERKSVPKWVNDAMIKTGTVHILVVSGFNVGIVAFIFLTFLKVLRVGRRPRILLTMALVVIYCLLTGASTPVIRATVMGLVLLLGYLMEREPDIYNSLALAALIILAFSPWQILDVGFQLSFISVLSIAWFYPKIISWISPRIWKVKYLNTIIQMLAVSFSAWLGTAGLIAYYFNMVSPVTVLANMIMIPLTSFITACGFALVIAGKILPSLGHLFAGSCALAILGLLKVNSILVRLKGAYCYIQPLPLYLIFGYYLLMIVLFGGLAFLVKFLKPGPPNEFDTFGAPK